MAFYLALKEILRYRGRFLLFSLVITLITTLVLFIAALAQGLSNASNQYLEKLDADLIVFQKNVNLNFSASRLSLDKLRAVRRLPEVAEVGPIGFANGTIISNSKNPKLDVSLIGLEPNQLGMPPVVNGEPFYFDRGNQAVIDQNVVMKTGLKVGDKMVIKTIIGTKEEFKTVEIVGISDEEQFLYAPSVFLPYETWDNIRPQAGQNGQGNSGITNVIAVKLVDPTKLSIVAKEIEEQVQDVEVVDRKTAYESSPGYKAQQSTLDTQRAFSLLVGILVIGGFFQIQTLQKIPQIGVLKAIGTSDFNVATVVILQIIIVTVVGVLLGTVVTFGLSLIIPKAIPVVFTGKSAVVAVISLLFIGPIGGLVSIRSALQVEPLSALSRN
ncbi:MAG: ABC transporter permease [Anaerolineales bacterium]